jgi:hypothetical protein
MSADFVPNFQLPPCPACSSHSSIVRPCWRLAKNTTRSTGNRTWTFVGCEHAAEVSGIDKLYSDPELIAIVEGAWAHLAGQLFDEKVVGMSPKARDDFRRNLVGRVPLSSGDAGRLEF